MTAYLPRFIIPALFYLALLSLAILSYIYDGKVRENKCKPFIIFFILLLIGLLVRFPFFFPSVINWDESTFIIVAQDVLNGNLPFVHLWDLKPPLLYLFYSFFLLFGKSIVMVRIGGLLAVVGAAYIVYLTGNRVYKKSSGLWGAFLTIIYSSTFGAGQATMGEHILLIPMSFLLFLLLTKKHTHIIVFLIGLLLSISILIRTNVVYIVPGVFVIIFLELYREEITSSAKKLFSFFCGGILPVLITGLIYYFNNAFDTLSKAAISAPLSKFSEVSINIFNRGISFLNFYWGSILSNNFLIWAVFIAGLFYFHSKKGTEVKKHSIILLVLFVSISISIMKMGYHGHYLIHLVPFMALVGGGLLSYLFNLKYRRYVCSLALFGIFLPLTFVSQEYGVLYSKILQKDPLRGDKGYQLANYLTERNVSGKYIFVCGRYHIVYWLTDAKLPTRYVQPSNLFREFYLKAIEGEQATVASEFNSIFKKKPVYVIVGGRCSHNKKWALNFSEEVQRNYELETRLDQNTLIYKRKNDD